MRNGKEMDYSKNLYTRLDDPKASDDDMDEVIDHLISSTCSSIQCSHITLLFWIFSKFPRLGEFVT